jgi:heme-degrading monooxygenase HmoA
MDTINPEQRIATTGGRQTAGPVVLMNGFVVAPERDEAFHAMWDVTSRYFMAQPGFVSLRLHRAVSADAPHRWVNVATWESEDDYRAAHSTPEFRTVVTAPGWEEFPSSPQLYEVVTSAG